MLRQKIDALFVMLSVIAARNIRGLILCIPGVKIKYTSTGFPLKDKSDLLADRLSNMQVSGDSQRAGNSQLDSQAGEKACIMTCIISSANYKLGD